MKALNDSLNLDLNNELAAEVKVHKQMTVPHANRKIVTLAQSPPGAGGVRREIKFIDNSDQIKEHQELGFAMQLRQPLLQPAGGEQFNIE